MSYIEQIKSRLQATTKGKWIAHGENYRVGTMDTEPCITTENDTYICQTVYDHQSCTEEHNIKADTIFIANAKDDIEYLLQSNEQLQQRVKELTEALKWLKKQYDDDFYPEEIKELCVREQTIYEHLEKVLKQA